jgi:hypothetical protein
VIGFARAGERESEEVSGTSPTVGSKVRSSRNREEVIAHLIIISVNDDVR